MTAPISVLIVSKGHDYNHDSFLAMFAAMEGVTTTLVQQPAAQVILQREHAGAYDCVLFYDMSGIPGIGLLHDGANNTGVPPEPYRRAIEGLLARGTGLVLLNHATVSGHSGRCGARFRDHPSCCARVCWRVSRCRVQVIATGTVRHRARISS